jgi:hypothetical protein
MSEYIYNAKRGWVNVEEAFNFIKRKKIEDVNDPNIYIQHHLRYGDKHEVPLTSRPLNRGTSVELPKNLTSNTVTDILISLHQSFKNFKNEVNKKRMSRDLVKVMFIYAKINNLIRQYDPSFRGKIFKTTASGFRRVDASIAELGTTIQEKIKNNEPVPARLRPEVYTIVAYINTYIRETAKFR